MGLSTQKIISLCEQYMVANYTRKPVALVRGEDVYIWDADGKRYLDLFPGWACDGIGHCHPKVVAAIREQAGRLIHVANDYYMEPQVILAKKLSERSFGGKCFFCNSGAEANEAAIKLARLAHAAEGRYKVVTMRNSFHGRTLTTVAATGQEKYHKGLGPLPPGFVYVDLNDISQLEAAVDDETCAIMLEPIQGEGGINISTPEFMQAVRRLCDERGMVMILDEVQTGMGRTGEWFGYQHYDVVPDVISLAKALAGGVAMGAIVARPELAEFMVPGTHASTFGGNPLACAAAIATIDAIEEENLLENARTMGQYAREKLDALARRLPVIEEVRNVGLMIGVELNRPGADAAIECMKRGLLTNCTHETVMRLMPPMTVRKEHLDEGLDILAGVLEEMA